MAEIVAHYFPKLVELHNYSPAHNSVQKMYNWGTLNQKVGMGVGTWPRVCTQKGAGPPSHAAAACSAPAQKARTAGRHAPGHCRPHSPPRNNPSQVFRRMGFSLAREQQEAVANAEAGAVERVLKLVRAKMARFQEGGVRAGAGAGAGTTDASTSQPGSPARFAAASPAAAVDAAADSIAAVRLAAEVPAKLLAGGGAGGAQAAFPTLDQALAASLADKEQQLEELRETNEVGGRGGR